MKKMTLLLLIFSLLIPQTSVFAENAYNTYSYDVWDNAISSPDGYDVSKVLTGKLLDIGDFSSPQDLFVYNDDTYLVDTGNRRIIVLDGNYKVKQIISSFNLNGEPVELSDAVNSVYIRDDILYLADTGNECVWIGDMNGNFTNKLVMPETEMMDTAIGFKPKKILADSGDTIYLICEGINKGAVMLDMNNKFKGFYGANKISTTLELIAEMFWRRFMSEAQIEQMKQFHPVEYTNFYIDKNDFIYTVTMFTEGTDEIKKLNPNGDNTFESKTYGDINAEKANEFVDICVNDGGYVAALSSGDGKIFEYDSDGNILMIFGGIGGQEGTFSIPCAIDNHGDNLLVLDSAKNNITIFKPTTYTQYLHEAVELYAKGNYEETVKPWREVLRLNSNMQFAYTAIAKSQDLIGEHKEAMKNYKIGYNDVGYSEAKENFRSIWLQKYFVLVMILFIAVMVYLDYLSKKRYNEKRGIVKEKKKKKK